ncbi:MAG: DUF3025 domain-containing protein [Noviherbaspirillum sp.]
MSAHFLDDIDWQRPWLAPLREVGRAVAQARDWRSALNALATERGLRNHRGLPLQFVPQASLPQDVAYEAFISATGGVPTRENLHDLFNALIWLTFPRIKTQLNAMQAAAIEKAGAGSSGVTKGGAVRGQLRDAATIFDENAALLVARDRALVEAFRAHRWHEIFVTRRAAFGRDLDIWLFGHALMEKLVTPYKAITAHALPLVIDASSSYFDMPMEDKRAWLDVTIAQTLSNGLSTSDFTPLPVLGIPDWWDTQDEAFYADTSVFRPKRRE